MRELDLLREIEIMRYLLEQIEEIEGYTNGVDEEGFLRSSVVKNATMMKLIVIGEYSGQINDELKDRFSEIEWQLIKAARNYYAHVYRAVDWLRVWEVVNNELQPLKNKLLRIVELLETEYNGKTN